MIGGTARLRLDDLAERQGRAAYRLAVHLALVPATDAALVHHVRDNFLLDGPDGVPNTLEGELLVARLLLSPLFQLVGDDLYEMERRARFLLLNELQAVDGGRRLRAVAALVERYTLAHPVWAAWPELRSAQLLSVWAALEPDRAASWLEAGHAGGAGGDGRRFAPGWFVAMRRRLTDTETDGADEVRAHLREATSALEGGALDRAVASASSARATAERVDADPRVIAEVEALLGRLADARAAAAGGEAASELRASGERHLYRAAELYEAAQDGGAVGRVLTDLGGLLLAAGRVADAVQALQGAVQRLPGAARPQIALARALTASEQPQAAMARYGSVLVAAPDEVEALVGRGVVGAEHGDPAAALADLDAASRLAPEVAGRAEVVAARRLALSRFRP